MDAATDRLGRGLPGAGEPGGDRSGGRGPPPRLAERTPRSAADAAESARLATVIGLIVAVLAALGVVLVYSSTSVGIALRADDETLFLRRQVLWVALAAGVFVLARTCDLRALRRTAPLVLAGALVALALVLVPGVGARVNGARRWIRAGSFNCQPSEAAKVALLVFVAAYAAARREELRRLAVSLPALGAVGVTGALIAREPDMGTALLTTGTATAVLVVAGLPLRHLLLVGLPAAGLAVAYAWHKLPYVWRRIDAFLDPGLDPGGVAYQTTQALIALGAGGPFGVGLGASQQKRLFLPDVHTDFIFALVGEELGFVGAVGVVLLFAALVAYGMRAVHRARDTFQFLLATGVVLLLGTQAVLNVAVATASVPPKGIALPFLSFGGSSLLMAACCAGLLARVAAQGRAPFREGAPEDEPDIGARTPDEVQVA